MRALALASTALGWLLLAKLRHRREPTPALIARLRRPPPRIDGRTGGRIEPAAMHWALAAVSRRLPWRSDCLIQALAAKAWLNRRGVAATLHLGVQTAAGGGIVAHAWLEVDGAPVSGGPADPRLAPFAHIG